MKKDIDLYVEKKYNNWLSLCRTYSSKLGGFDPSELLNEVLLQMYQSGLKKAIEIFNDKPYKLDLYIKSSIRINAYSINSPFNRLIKGKGTVYLEEIEFDRWEIKVSVFDKRAMRIYLKEALCSLNDSDLNMISKRFDNKCEPITQSEYVRIRGIISNIRHEIFNKRNNVRYERPT